MKFTQYSPFEKSIKEGYPDHLSSIYVVICSKEHERKKTMEGLFRLLAKDRDAKRCNEVSEALVHLGGGSLLASKLLASVDALVSGDKDPLLAYVAEPNPQGILILGAENSKLINELYKKGKRDMIILDLSQEKPWEEKKRIEAWLLSTIKRHGKEISPEALHRLIDYSNDDRMWLEQEIEKLLCYLDTRVQLTLEDVDALCSDMSQTNLFTLAQSIAWGQKIDQLPEDPNQLFPLIGLIRNQLEMGLKMGAMLKKGLSKDQIKGTFPKLWPKAFDQILAKVSEKEASYIPKKLQKLFELELGLKTSRAKAPILLAIFCSP